MPFLVSRLTVYLKLIRLCCWSACDSAINELILLIMMFYNLQISQLISLRILRFCSCKRYISLRIVMVSLITYRRIRLCSLLRNLSVSCSGTHKAQVIAAFLFFFKFLFIFTYYYLPYNSETAGTS